MPNHLNDHLPPYPRLGECYRLLAKALDTKASNRNIDRLAREGDFDWQLLPGLREELIEAPLRKKTNENFARFVIAAVETLHDGYVDLVRTIPLDALTRAESLPALITHLYAPYAASFCLQMHKAIPSPPIVPLLDECQHPIEVTIAWLERELNIAPNQLGHRLYADSTGENKNGRDALQRWRQGLQLPSLNSINLLQQRLLSLYPQRERFINAFGEWLITARALVVFEQYAAPYLKLRPIILREILSDVPPEDIGVLLSQLNIQAAANRRSVVEGGLLLQEHLKRTTEKAHGDMRRTRVALEEFRQQLVEHDPNGVSAYYLEWLEGRWHVLAGQLEGALAHYEQAADLALYRSGETQKGIVREALLLAAYQGDLPLYKRLKHRALAMGLSYLPGWEHSVATAKELAMIRGNFEVKFPARGRFVEALKSEH